MVRTVKRTSFKRKPLNDVRMTGTMELPVEAVFEDIAGDSASHLEVHCPGRSPERISMTKADVKIGRDPECRIHLPLNNVSREHARILCNGEDYQIVDNGSTNGTYVNNVRVSKCVLRNRDVIRVGEAKILFVQQKL